MTRDAVAAVFHAEAGRLRDVELEGGEPLGAQPDPGIGVVRFRQPLEDAEQGGEPLLGDGGQERVRAGGQTRGETGTPASGPAGAVTVGAPCPIRKPLTTCSVFKSTG